MDLNPRVSVCQFSTYRWSFHEDVVRYATHGFDSIGVWRRKIDDYGAAAAIDLLYEAKMTVSSVHWAGGFTGDGQTFSDAIEDAIESIQLASRINAACLIIHPGSRNGHTTTHAFRLFNSALSTLVPIAADYGVKLALEPMISKQASSWTFMESLDHSIELMKNFPAQNLGWAFDTYHFGFDAELYERLDDLVGRLEVVQLADRNLLNDKSNQCRQGYDSYRLPLGHGQVPIEAWLSKLQRLGYSGGYELEVHGAAVDGADYHTLLDLSADYFSSTNINALMDTRPRKEIGRCRQEINQRIVD